MSTGASTACVPAWASAHFDMLRAMAAFAVLVGHIRALFFVDAPQLVNPTLPVRGLYYVTGFGHQAVIVFFTLSGFLVGGSALRAKYRGCWSSTDYLLRRATRLYVVLLPALVLTLCWDLAGTWFFGNRENLYSGHTNGAALVVGPLAQTLTWSSFLANTFFLQTIVTPCFGTNSPLWSLANEFWYYILFPISLEVLARNCNVIKRAVAVALFWFLFSSFLPLAFWEGFVIWLMGAGSAALVERGHTPQKFARLRAGLVAFLAAITLHWTRTGNSPLEDVALGLILACLLWSLSCVIPETLPPQFRFYGALARVASSFSFSLYVVHFPVLVFVATLTVQGARWQPSTRAVSMIVLATSGVLLYAYIFSRCTEKHTEALRLFLAERLRRARLSPSGAIRRGGIRAPRTGRL